MVKYLEEIVQGKDFGSSFYSVRREEGKEEGKKGRRKNGGRGVSFPHTSPCPQGLKQIRLLNKSSVGKRVVVTLIFYNEFV